jgi:hypothetical protein
MAMDWLAEMMIGDGASMCGIGKRHLMVMFITSLCCWCNDLMLVEQQIRVV